LKQRLDLIYAGTPTDAVEDHALALVVQHHQLPRLFLDALLEGFAWDAQGRRYQTMEDLQAYAARVAATVGGMMCWIMGPQAPLTLARACELGVAMQLTNIARDVGEDARNGRIYLPLQWMVEAGVQPDEWLQNPKMSANLKTVIERVLQEAERLYKQAQAGIAELPADCRAAILAASLIYAEIGHQLRREGLDSVTHRTVVSTRRKLVLLATAWTQSGWIYAQRNPVQPLPAIAFLIAPEVLKADERMRTLNFPNRAMPQRIEWVLGLFERLENERRGRKTASQPL
jgi:phytoene synthase